MNFRVSVIKKNQILTWGLIIVLVIAGYLNYTNDPQNLYSVEVADIYEPELGDAVFVDSDNLVTNVDELITDVKNQNFVKTSDEFFSESRINRNKLYSEQLETYEAVLKDASSSEASIKFAQEEVIRINNEKNAVSISENLIRLKGIEEVVILINGESVNVVVLDDELTESKIAQIQNALPVFREGILIWESSETYSSPSICLNRSM